MQETIEPAPVLRMYEITEALIELESILMASGGVMDEDTEQRFDELTKLAENKAGGYYRIIANFKRTADAYKAEMDRLARAHSAAKNGAVRVLKRLEEQMKMQGKTEQVCDIGKFKLVASGAGSVQFKKGKDVNDLPPEYVKQAEPTAKKKDLMKGLKDGDARLNHLVEILPAVPTIRMY